MCCQATRIIIRRFLFTLSQPVVACGEFHNEWCTKTSSNTETFSTEWDQRFKLIKSMTNATFFHQIIGQVWDSVAHPSQTAVAIPFALFPKNMIMQSSVRFLLRLHLKTYKTLTDHFENAMQHFYLNLSRAPALVIASKVDPIGTDDFNQEIVAKWKAHGMDVNYVCFDDSEHIKHMQKYPKEYTKAMHDLWDKVKLLERK